MRCLLVAVLLLAACGDSADTQTIEHGEAPCPVTIPPAPGHTPSSDHPATPAVDGMVWYGTDDLWTPLDVDGHYVPRKSVWWSTHFDPAAEPQPDLRVVYRQLDGEGRHEHAAPGTNAFTPEDGDFMINGIDPDEAGCWEVTASYRDATLQYVYERPES